MGYLERLELQRLVIEWANARKAVTDSDWQKKECTPAMIQRLASAEQALMEWTKTNGLVR